MTRSETNWTGVVFGVWLGIVAAYEQFKLPAVLPLLLELYGYDRTLAGGFMSVYAIAGLFLSVRLGRAMRQGRAIRYVQGSLGLFVVGNLVGLARPELGWLVLLGRGLEGLGFSVLAIACSVYANAHISPRHLPLAAALVATWIPAGQLMAVVVAPGFVAAGEWRPLWWLGIALAAASAAWALRLSRTGRIVVNPRASGASRSGSDISPAERRGLVLGAATFTLWSTQVFAYLTWMPQYLVEEYGLAMADAVLVYGLPILVLIAFNLIGGIILRARAPIAGVLALVLAIQGLVWLALPAVGPDLTGLLSLLVYGAACGVTPTCLFALPATVLGTARAGADAFGLLHTGRSLGTLIGPLLMAEAVVRLGGWNQTAPIFAGVCFAGVFLATAFGRQLRVVHASRPPAAVRAAGAGPVRGSRPREVGVSAGPPPAAPPPAGP